MSTIYQLKVTLKGTRPPIWRRLIVPGNLNFEQLHHVLQDAMGWENSHLHSFEVGGEEIGSPDLDAEDVQSGKLYTLDRVGRAKARFTYLYDFGDSWEHDILVEKVTTGELEAPRCLEGARACPPEDCGGVPGYAELVRATTDPSHERHEELSDWVGDGWSSERFNLEATNRLVSRHRPQPKPPRPARKPRVRAGARSQPRERR